VKISHPECGENGVSFTVATVSQVSIVGLVIGGVIGGLVIVGIIVFVGILLYRKKYPPSYIAEITDVVIHEKLGGGNLVKFTWPHGLEPTLPPKNSRKRLFLQIWTKKPRFYSIFFLKLIF
jgi:hypothetical protein